MPWLLSKDGDAEVRAIFDRHYSRTRYADGRKPKLFVGPGQKMVLLSTCRRAVFAWRKFITRDGQSGVNCAFFRNEGCSLSSGLLFEAMLVAWARWPGARFFTYVKAVAVKSANPGYCFKILGWKFIGRTKRHKLHILAFEPGVFG